MRHRKSGVKLGRTSSHRKAMFRNMTTSLLRHEAIVTTEAKAKALRGYVEPLITLARAGGLANIRKAERDVKDKEILSKLFEPIVGLCKCSLRRDKFSLQMERTLILFLTVFGAALFLVALILVNVPKSLDRKSHGGLIVFFHSFLAGSVGDIILPTRSGGALVRLLLLHWLRAGGGGGVGIPS